MKVNYITAPAWPVAKKPQTLEVVIIYSKYHEFSQNTKEQNLSKQGCMLLWLQNIEGVD